jgi:hypothetical protein
VTFRSQADHLVAESREEEWLAVRDVAVLLSVSTWQVRKWLILGQFDEIAVLGPKLTRISRASYDRFVAKNRREIA